jgi:hypothetical protein
MCYDCHFCHLCKERTGKDLVNVFVTKGEKRYCNTCGDEMCQKHFDKAVKFYGNGTNEKGKVDKDTVKCCMRKTCLEGYLKGLLEIARKDADEECEENEASDENSRKEQNS